MPTTYTTHYLAGHWTESSGTTPLPVHNSATEELIASVTGGDATDVDRAVEAARAAQPAWAATSRADRAEVLRRLAAELESRAGEMAATIVGEVGTPIRIAERIQARLPITIVNSYADLLGEPQTVEHIGNSLVVREPVGVVAAITPWNYPLHQITNKLAPALAAGCSIVVKPSEVAPLSARLLFDAIDAAGVPAGVANLVTGTGADVGEPLVLHEGVDMVSFTGSTAAGKRVGELAASRVIKTALELGGKSANVILDDADLAAAVKVGVANAFLNGGQTCTAWTRMLVPRSRYDEALELIAAAAATFVPGDPASQSTKLGPMVSARQRDSVLGFIRTGIDEGARVVGLGENATDVPRQGYYVAPTVLADVDPDSTVAQQEIFGPVLAVIPYGDESEALQIANNSDYGLAGAVWSADEQRALAFARQMQTGGVDINGAAYNPLAPFGGYKRSGIGRELGRYGLEEFQQIKSIQQ